jgi:glycosyltransferase involved in cell wall biosynthesis
VSLHVGLDLLFLVPGETGGREAYARELLRALRGLPGDLRVTAFLNRESAAAGLGWWSELPDRAVVLRRVWARRPAAWALGEVAGVARAGAAAGVDVLHSPANFTPAVGPFARVLTLHDLMFRAHPGLVGAVTRAGTEAVLVPGARAAHRIITATAASRDEIVAELGIPAERIAIVAHGAHPPARGEHDIAAVRARLGAGERPLTLAVGTQLPHKNHTALLGALQRLPRDERPLLVVVGHGTEALATEVGERGLVGDVRLLGGVDAATLEDLYAAADAYLTATRHEGFGLPLIEALGRGVPVAASGIPVLREVGRDAALWFDAERPDAIAAAWRALLAGGPELERRRERGRTLAAHYTWAATATATARVYTEALAARRGPNRPA